MQVTQVYECSCRYVVVRRWVGLRAMRVACSPILHHLSETWTLDAQTSATSEHFHVTLEALGNSTA